MEPALSAAFDRPIVIANVPGADGQIGLQRFIKEKAEDAIMITGTQLAYLSAVRKNLDFDPLKDFEPLYGLSRTDVLLLTSSKSSITNFSELVTYGKTKQSLMGAVQSPTTGISMSEIDSKFNTVTTLVSYKQSAQAVIDLAAGRIDYTISSSGNGAAQPLIDAGYLRPIAVLGLLRSPAYPKLKTLKEQGFDTVNDFGWTAFFINSSLSPALKKDYAEKLKRVMNSDYGANYENIQGKPHRLLMNAQDVKKKQLAKLAAIIKYAK